MLIKKQKVFIVMFGLIITTVMLEVSFRLAGIIYRAYRINNKQAVAKEDRNIVKILCLGDSFTFGSGASKGYSYPDQLGQLLMRDGIMNFKIYNEGVSSFNSSQALKNLSAQFLKYNPDVVIVMIGINDNWNFADSNYYLFANNKQSGLIYKFDSFMMKSKFYKLLKIISLNLRSKLLIYRINPVTIKRTQSYNSVPETAMKERIGYYAKLTRDSWNERSRDDKNAILALNTALGIDPCNKEILHLLGDIYVCVGPINLAIDTYKKIIELDPYDTKAHKVLFDSYRKIGEIELAERQAKIIMSFEPENSIFKKFLITGIPSYNHIALYKNLIYYNLDQMVRFAKSKNKIIILQNYPRLHYDTFLNNTIKEVAYKYGIHFVDNLSIFDKLESSENYFVKDGHCNANGYRIIAENVYTVLVSELNKEG